MTTVAAMLEAVDRFGPDPVAFGARVAAVLEDPRLTPAEQERQLAGIFEAHFHAVAAALQRAARPRECQDDAGLAVTFHT